MFLAIIDPPVGGADMVRRLHEAEDRRTTAPAARPWPSVKTPTVHLLNSGKVPIAVAAWAGHADGGATALKHYIRVRPGDLEAARDAIAALPGRVSVPGRCEKL